MAKVNNEITVHDKLQALSNRTNLNFGLKKTEFISTGYTVLDLVFGGGIPKGKILQIYSESGYGKTTIVMSICKKLCRRGLKVVYVDSEGAIDSLAESMGFFGETVEGKKFPSLVYDPKTNPNGNFIVIGECTFEKVEQALDTLIPRFDSRGNPLETDVALVVIDSIPFLEPAKFIQAKDTESITKARVGANANILAEFSRKLNAYKISFNTSFIFVNQLRANINVDRFSGGNTYGDKVYGGKTLTYLIDENIKLHAGTKQKKKVKTAFGEQETSQGREVMVEALKNKITKGSLQYPIYVNFGKGISNVASLPYILPHKTIMVDKKEIPMLTEGGGWFTLNFYGVDEKGKKQLVTKKVHGRTELIRELVDNYKYFKDIVTVDDLKKIYVDSEEGLYNV